MIISKNFRISNECKKAMSLLAMNFGANLIMLKRQQEYNKMRLQYETLKFASSNNIKPHTADKPLTEKELEAVRKQLEVDLRTAMRHASEILSQDLVYLVRKQAFYASFAVDMKKNITVDVPIAAVNVINSISNIYINPITYPELEKRERIGVIIHEILHLALLHVFRYLDLPDNEKFHYLWNLACDCAINQLIPNTVDIGLPKGAIFPETFKQYGIDVPYGLTAEQTYKILLENRDKLPDDMNGGMDDKQDNSNEQNDNGDQSQNSNGNGESQGQQGQGKHKNWHSKWGESQGSRKVNEAAVKNSLKKAYTRNAGKLPGDLKRLIEDIIESKVPWHRKFAQIYAKFLRADFVKTNRRESRRLGDLAKGRRQKRKLSVVVITDTSMSITDENLAEFTGHIVKIWKQGVKITIIEADARISEVYEFKGKISRINYGGGGGTSFVPPFEHILKERMEVDLVIYLTDGFGDAPDKFNYAPTIWCLVPNGQKPRAVSGGEVKWGEVVKVY